MPRFTLHKGQRNARVQGWEGEPEQFVLSYWFSLRSAAIQSCLQKKGVQWFMWKNHHPQQSSPQTQSVMLLKSNMKKRESRSPFLSRHNLQGPLQAALLLSSPGRMGRRSWASIAFLELIPWIKIFPFPRLSGCSFSLKKGKALLQKNGITHFCRTQEFICVVTQWVKDNIWFGSVSYSIVTTLKEWRRRKIHNHYHPVAVCWSHVPRPNLGEALQNRLSSTLLR